MYHEDGGGLHHTTLGNGEDVEAGMAAGGGVREGILRGLYRVSASAHGEAQAHGLGVVLLDGRLIENLHVEDAHRVLALAGAIASSRVSISE